jgi:ribosome maturation factor RimP
MQKVHAKNRELEQTFERTLDAIEHDATFEPIEIVRRGAHPLRGAMNFSVTVDRPGGADLALCERIAGRLNAALDAVQRSYTLQVESAGLERPLLGPRDFERFSGNAARVVTTLAINGEKTHRGVLRGMRNGHVVLETGRGELLLPPATIKSAHLEYDPRADFQREKRERKHGANN